MKSSFIVIGIGRFGGAVAKTLAEQGHEVLAVDKLEAHIEDVSDFVTHAIIADCSEERTLKALGVQNYDCAIVATAQDLGDSVLITRGLKELGAKQIICKARDVRHKKILLKIGADRVVIPEHEAGAKLALHLSDPKLIDTLDLSDIYGISELHVPDRWIGKTVGELNVRRKHGCVVVAIKKPEEHDEIVVAPGAEYVFMAGDILVLLGEHGLIAEVTHL